MSTTPSLPSSAEAACLAGAVPGMTQYGFTAYHHHLPVKPAQPSCGSASPSPLYLPEIVTRRDGLLCKLVIQPAKRIVRITFRRGFIKITVPFNLNSYHTTLNKRERQCEFCKLSSINVFSDLSDPWARSPRGQEQPHCWSQTGAHTLLDGPSSCL